MILHLLLFFSILGPAEADCNRVCKGRSREFPILYPFGFSDGCEIRLECADNGEISTAGNRVLNLTKDTILINLPAICNRRFPIHAQNFAPTRRNRLLLGNCSQTLNDCVVSTSIIQSRFNLPSCESTNYNLTCYSDDYRDSEEFINKTRLENAGCRVLYSSVTVDLNGSSTQVWMGFQSVEMGWWVEGDCRCHQKAICKNVSVGYQRLGYRCHCTQGYDGDGFVDGDGCRRVSKCNASKYMSGECGGTTRIAVLIGGIIIGASFVSTIALVCYCIRKRATLRSQMSAKRLLSEATESFNIPSYPYKEIEKATGAFSEKQRLGIGAYGTVYSGKLHHDWVAIKRIRHKESYGIDQVMNEIKLISSVSHPNLVRLLGFCIDKGEQILIYEFMPNGTLSQHLQRERGKGLSWTVRLTIATQTAQAIAYLHTAMNPPIYHRDIKSSNILVDYNYSSKVADFGLSRLGMLDESHISTAPQGTPGYVDPQYHQNFHLSDKSDVYSFGVVLVEIITALKVVDLSRRNSEVNLAALAIDKIGKGRVDEIIDPFVEPNRDAWTLSSIYKVAELAFRCLAFHGDMRPSMTEVADELERIRLSGWAQTDDNISKASFSVASSSSSPYNGSEKPKMVEIASRRLMVPHTISDLGSGRDKDNSPVSVQEGWLSKQSSPSTNSLLNNIVQ